jgi:rhodanese-related sulfurtransferase
MRKWNLTVPSLAFLVAFTATTALGADFNFVTTGDLKKMLDNKEKLVLAHALSPIEFAEKHIPGSVNIPPELIKTGEVSLPEDKGAKIIFYCMGPK